MGEIWAPVPWLGATPLVSDSFTGTSSDSASTLAKGQTLHRPFRNGGLLAEGDSAPIGEHWRQFMWPLRRGRSPKEQRHFLANSILAREGVSGHVGIWRNGSLEARPQN